jgi:hypothetical protein
MLLVPVMAVVLAACQPTPPPPDLAPITEEQFRRIVPGMSIADVNWIIQPHSLTLDATAIQFGVVAQSWSYSFYGRGCTVRLQVTTNDGLVFRALGDTASAAYYRAGCK